MRRSLFFIILGFKTLFIYRTTLIFYSIGNFIFVIVTWFLWKAIYLNERVINGMTFEQTFVYLAMATSIFSLFQTSTDWSLSARINNGGIMMDLLKPVRQIHFTFFTSLGFVITNFLAIAVPSLFLMFFVFNVKLVFGLNIPFFLVSIILAYGISFNIDYMVGTTAFYNEAIWGICITKEVVMLFLSGALLPLSFFPDSIRRVAELLPFQAIYNLPLQILVSKTLTPRDYLNAIIIQLFWLAALSIASRLFFHTASRRLTVNGG